MTWDYRTIEACVLIIYILFIGSLASDRRINWFNYICKFAIIVISYQLFLGVVSPILKKEFPIHEQPHSEPHRIADPNSLWHP